MIVRKSKDGQAAADFGVGWFLETPSSRSRCRRTERIPRRPPLTFPSRRASSAPPQDHVIVAPSEFSAPPRSRVVRPSAFGATTRSHCRRAERIRRPPDQVVVAPSAFGATIRSHCPRAEQIQPTPRPRCRRTELNQRHPRGHLLAATSVFSAAFRSRCRRSQRPSRHHSVALSSRRALSAPLPDRVVVVAKALGSFVPRNSEAPPPNKKVNTVSTCGWREDASHMFRGLPSRWEVLPDCHLETKR